ncbi:unnamed protein product, partial [Staurois parvus]
HRVHGDSNAVDSSWTSGSRGLNGTLAVESGLAQQGQFRTRVVGAHNRDSSGHGWLVHTTGTVQVTGSRCARQGQFRTRVVSAHNRDSSGHRWSVRTTGTVQDTHGK